MSEIQELEPFDRLPTVMAVLVTAIHVFPFVPTVVFAWMTGTSPGHDGKGGKSGA